MAEFTFDGYKVYYETHGTTGEPLVILNGIMMSTASWRPFLKTESGSLANPRFSAPKRNKTAVCVRCGSFPSIPRRCPRLSLPSVRRI